MPNDVGFSVAKEIWSIAGDLIGDHYPDLIDAKILYLFTTAEPKRNGRVLYAKTSKMSPLQRFLDSGKEGVEAGSDYVIVFTWATWIRHAASAWRRALVDHELAHCELKSDDEGNDTWAIRGHDVEEFTEIIQRHGLWDEDLLAMGEVVQQLPMPLALSGTHLNGKGPVERILDHVEAHADEIGEQLSSDDFTATVRVVRDGREVDRATGEVLTEVGG